MHSFSGSAFTSPMRMRSGVLCRTSHGRTNSHMSFSSCFAEVDIFPLLVSNLADCCQTIRIETTNLARGQVYHSMPFFQTHYFCGSAGLTVSNKAIFWPDFKVTMAFFVFSLRLCRNLFPVLYNFPCTVMVCIFTTLTPNIFSTSFFTSVFVASGLTKKAYLPLLVSSTVFF